MARNYFTVCYKALINYLFTFAAGLQLFINVQPQNSWDTGEEPM